MSQEKRNYFDSFTENEKISIQETQKYFSREFEFWEKSFNVLVEAFELISNSSAAKYENWSHSKMASFLLVPILIMSTKASLELLIRGYYFDFMVVNRNQFESLALLLLLSKDEKKAEMWIDGKKVEVPKWKLMHQLLPTKRYYRRVNKFYSTLSEFAHSDFAAIAKDWKRQLSRKKEAFVFHQFKKSFVGEALASPLNLLITLTLTEVFREELGEDFRNKVIDLAKGKVLEWEAEGFLRD